MGSQSTPKRRRRKTNRPTKPYPAFPLYAHPSGMWAKKIRGEFHYFGRWGNRENGTLVRVEGDGWQEALESYKRQADDLHAGRTPRVKSDELTVGGLCNNFLTAKLRQMESHELSPRAFVEYRRSTDLVVATFGKQRLVLDLAPDDFADLRASMANRWGPSRLGKFVQMIRTVFKYCADNGLVERPVRFGSSFNKPGKAVMRRNKAASGKKLFAAAELRLILEALDGKQVSVNKKGGKPIDVELKSNPQMRAMTLLGINCGLGNTDVSGLQFSHLDLDSGWLDFPREKTGLPRRCPLWPQTITALGAVIAKRRKPKHAGDSDCLFINRDGRRMVQSTEAYHQDYVSSQFRALLRKLNINGRRGLGFYSLRHSFATIGLQSRDRDAVKAIMGHASHDMLSIYDETGPDDSRLLAVTNHVHKWLFA